MSSFLSRVDRVTAERVVAGVFTIAAVASLMRFLSGHGPSLPPVWTVVWLLCVLVSAGTGACVLYITTLTYRTRRVWSRARTLADLGVLTAAWLEGRLPATPTYQGRPDPETGEIRDVLARVNRAGYVTDDSQPHRDESGGGVRWRQRDTVRGFCGEPMMERLRALAEAGGLEYRIHRGFVRRTPADPGITVALRGPHAEDMGRQQTFEDLSFWAGACSPLAVRELTRAWQVTLVGPWDRPGHLWQTLDAAFAS